MESRTWEQMRADNNGVAWIDENGDFCKKFSRDNQYLPPEEKSLPGWKQTGFNGCWSCVHYLNCIIQRL